jgi:hypothetical protein
MMHQEGGFLPEFAGRKKKKETGNEYGEPNKQLFRYHNFYFHKNRYLS